MSTLQKPKVSFFETLEPDTNSKEFKDTVYYGSDYSSIESTSHVASNSKKMLNFHLSSSQDSESSSNDMDKGGKVIKNVQFTSSDSQTVQSHHGDCAVPVNPVKSKISTNKENIENKTESKTKTLPTTKIDDKRNKANERKFSNSNQKTKMSGDKKPSEDLWIRRNAKLLERSKKTVVIKDPKLNKNVVKPMKIPSKRRSETKTSVVRNTADSKTDVYIGPGLIPHQNLIIPSKAKAKMDSTPIRTPDSNNLNRPEYNSIVNTIKKLEETKKSANLPSGHKQNIAKKVASALNFSPTETIFRDLINLSIDEEALPKKTVRTYNFESRKKDVEPKLSDFFTPEYSEEYKVAVDVRPPTPDEDKDYDAFKISNKIFHWKMQLDQV